METLTPLLNYILHIDSHLIAFVTQYGLWTYALLFTIIFCETGLIVIPFLPGDSLLFAAGAISAGSENTLNIHILFILLVLASITGNGLNYFVGQIVGPRIFYKEKSWFFNKNYLNKTHQFYERFGGKTIIIARFMPIIRTFAPFVAGIGKMKWARFYFYNILGAILWVGSLLYISYWFGNLPIVKSNFSYIVMSIIGLSIIPPLVELVRHKFFNSSI